MAEGANRERETWDLFVTERCCRDDLGLNGPMNPDEISQSHDSIVSCFREKRSQRPIGLERILVLKRDIYSLHCGRSRGATWYQPEHDVVWLLGSGKHEEGSQTDAYEIFASLLNSDKLLPTETDYEALFEWRDSRLSTALTIEPTQIVERAKADPGVEVRGSIAGMVEVSVVSEIEGDLECLFVAIKMELGMDGEFRPPKEWLALVLAGFFRNTPFDRLLECLEPPTTPFPTRAIHDNELLFLDCWETRSS